MSPLSNMTKLLPEVPTNANVHCPGPESETAGKVDSCAGWLFPGSYSQVGFLLFSKGCPNQQVCASGEALLPDPAIEQIALAMKDVSRRILVLSGKGSTYLLT